MLQNARPGIEARQRLVLLWQLVLKASSPFVLGCVFQISRESVAIQLVNTPSNASREEMRQMACGLCERIQVLSNELLDAFAPVKLRSLSTERDPRAGYE